MAVKIDLDKLSIKELLELKTGIDQKVASRRESERSDLKKKMAQMAEDAGFSIDEVLGRPKTRKGASIAKYRNPSDPSQTWTGRGRKPQWLIERLEKGADQDEFLIA